MTLHGSTSTVSRTCLQQYSPHPICPRAGQFAAYVNAVKEAFDLETVCKCRSSRDYTQKSIPTPGTFWHLLQTQSTQLACNISCLDQSSMFYVQHALHVNFCL